MAVNRKATLTRETILESLEELSETLAESGVRATAYIVGGAAIVLAHRHRTRTTVDIDALSLDEEQAVLAFARDLADKKGLALDWLKTEVKKIIDTSLPEDKNAEVVFESPSLVVTGASPEHLLAMKIKAGRDKDLNDIEFLARKLGMRSFAEAKQVHDALFPRHEIPDDLRKEIENRLVRIRAESSYKPLPNARGGREPEQ